MLQLGDLNVVQAILELEQRAITMEKVIDYLLTTNSHLAKPTSDQINAFRLEALTVLQNKYPGLGIKPAIIPEP